MIIPPLAATQQGCFTYAQATEVGWNYKLLASAVRRGHLHRVRRGIWIDRSVWDALDRQGQHVVTVQADVLVLPPGWFATRRSGAVVAALPLVGGLPLRPQLVCDKAGHPMSSFRQVAPLSPGSTTVRDGIPIAVLARIAVDMARTEPFLDAVVVADAVLASGVAKEQLYEQLEPLLHLAGADEALAVIDFADGLSESAMESMSRVRMHQRSLPVPELQVEIWKGNLFLGRADKLWRSQGVVGEDDGMAKLGSTADEVRRSTKQLYTRGLGIEDVGLVVARWDWDAAWYDGGKVMAERVLRCFGRAEGFTVDPDVRFVPTTVADRLRRQNRLAG